MKKQKIITEAGNSINEGVAKALNLPEGSDITALWRTVMNPSQLQMLELALFCEGEMLKTIQAGAHFSSCLMGAAMNEAFMALMCLMFEADVRGTRQFYHSTKKLKSFNYADVVSKWSLEQFINVSEQCGWISPEIVELEFITALANGFRELMPISHPEFSQEQIESGANAFFVSPGPSMLRMTQELRNAIHAGIWMKRPSAFNADTFVEWCRFATVLCGEIRLCLMHHLMARIGKLARIQASALKELISKLPPEALPILEEQMKLRLNIPTFAIEDMGKILEVLETAYPATIENN